MTQVYVMVTLRGTAKLIILSSNDGFRVTRSSGLASRRSATGVVRSIAKIAAGARSSRSAQNNDD